MVSQTEQVQQTELAATVTQPVVVAIGAPAWSAGSPDQANPLCTLFAALPNDLGAAYVVLHPAAAVEATPLPALLAGHTTMPVTELWRDELRESVRVEPDHIYGLPANHTLAVVDGALQGAPLPATAEHAFGIDAFLRALAPTYGDGIALLLAGNGSEGAVGSKAFRARGGLVLWQEPTAAAFNGSPTLNQADLILPVAQMAARLVDLVQSRAQLGRAAEQWDQAEVTELAQLMAFVEGRTGYDLSSYKPAILWRSVRRRLQLNGLQRYVDYLHLLRTKPDEVQAFYTDLLMTFPTFFQEPAALKVLAETVIPKLFTGKAATDVLRVWVAGCATGEDAYTLAMLLLEHAETLAHPPALQLFATDLDEQALACARAGRYPHAVVADLSAERLAHFFVHEGTHYQIKQKVRERIIFSHHSVLRDPPFAQIQLIACRHHLSKFVRAAQQQILAAFRYALQHKSVAPSYLFLGKADLTLLEEEQGDEFWQAIAPDHGILVSRPEHQLDRSLSPAFYKDWQQPGRRIHPRADSPPQPELRAHQVALETAAPPSILVDQSQQAIHFSESAGRYLQLPGGAVTSAIVRLVRPELREPLHQALTQALQQGQESFTAPIAVAFDGTPHLVHLLVYPVQQQPVKTRQALVIFIDTGPVIPAAPVNGAASALDKEQAHKAGASEQIVRLRTELAQAHDQLQRIRSAYSAAAEQQYTANEELQAINEEYRSIAEELQSSQEELQSLNEELRAVNTELKDKLREVSQAHSDLQNLMAVAEVGTLFLDQALRVRRFTAPVTRIFNITASDRGRSITDLTHQLTYANLVTDARQVMRDLTLIEQEIRSTDGDTYLVRLRPYRTVYHKIDGVVVTFVDITKHKAAEAALRASEERFRALADNIAQLAWMTDPAGAITWYNKRWYEYTGTTFADVQGWGWQTVHHPDHVARVVEKIRHCFATGAVWEDLFPLRSKTGEYRWFLSHAFPIRNAAGEIVRWFGTNTDVTEQRETEAALRRLNETLEERVEERTEQVRDLASKLTMSEQEERRRIAQILHDDLQQLLYGIQMRLDLLVMDAEAGDTERLADYAKEAYSWLGSAIRTTRQLTVDISPPVLEGEGVGEALQWLATQMAEINELQVKIVTAGSAVAVNGIHQDMRVLLFQVVRELLFNVVKHAATDHATVTIGPVAAGTLSITVEDDGCGFDVAAAETRYDGGFGLFSIRERLRLFGGWMQITSAPGKGTCITLAVPIAQMQWDSETVRQWDSEAVGQ